MGHSISEALRRTHDYMFETNQTWQVEFRFFLGQHPQVKWHSRQGRSLAATLALGMSMLQLVKRGGAGLLDYR